MKDLVDREEVSIKYCPTDEMLVDYMTKPTVGAKFKKMRDLIMNLSNIYHWVLQQECVGEVKRKVSGTQENDMSVEVEDINDIEEEK